jgi:hypothetical protein
MDETVALVWRPDEDNEISLYRSEYKTNTLESRFMGLVRKTKGTTMRSRFFDTFSKNTIFGI